MNKNEKTPPGQDKVYTITVNTKDHQVGHEVSFDQIVKLAFPNPTPGQNIGYTILFKKVDSSNKPAGQMEPDEIVKVKDGSTFTVTETDKS
jgi:hypothetical protein